MVGKQFDVSKTSPSHPEPIVSAWLVAKHPNVHDPEVVTNYNQDLNQTSKCQQTMSRLSNV